MDSLTLNQIISLVSTFGVRHVIPIHLANGPFGGSAVYNDLFNTNTWFLNNHQFFRVDFDPVIQFRLGVPNALQAFPGGAVVPTSIGQDEYNALGYQQGTGGHKNNLGLSDTQTFLALMQAGLLIDVAHMSEKATEMALTQAETYGYPLMDSHTGLRNATHAKGTERELLPSHALRIGNLGGVIGLGPAWNESPDCTSQNSPDPISDFLNDYQSALQIMGGRGVALGTDANGLQPLINCTKRPVLDYIHNVASKFGPPSGVPTPDLHQYQLGTHTYDINVDGIANYGMLPDFLEALSEQSSVQPAPAVAALYRSAEDVIKMWEKVVSASSNAVPPHIICQPGYGQCVTTAGDNFTLSAVYLGPKCKSQRPSARTGLVRWRAFQHRGQLSTSRPL
jgi:microsomal dipeptidase-like Zn-dependent dipeptidase